jgi:NAD(P)-dependent dehydrogenase (short-subunit alcohol dehydrogenase family)
LLPTDVRDRRARGKLSGKVALVTSGHSGIGRSVAIAFAKAGADVAIIYLNEHREAEDTRQRILRANGRCILIAGNVAREDFCRYAVKRTIAAFKRLDILVNNTAEQTGPAPQEIAGDQRDRSLRTNLLGMFRLTRAAMPYLASGGTIINTTAVTAWRDNAQLIDDAATTETIVSFTRSIARALICRRICVNAVTVAPTSSLDGVTPSYVLLAAQDGPFITGQALHAKAGEAAA